MFIDLKIKEKIEAIPGIWYNYQIIALRIENREG